MWHSSHSNNKLGELVARIVVAIVVVVVVVAVVTEQTAH